MVIPLPEPARGRVGYPFTERDFGPFNELIRKNLQSARPQHLLTSEHAKITVGDLVCFHNPPVHYSRYFLDFVLSFSKNIWQRG